MRWDLQALVADAALVPSTVVESAGMMAFCRWWLGEEEEEKAEAVVAPKGWMEVAHEVRGNTEGPWFWF